MDITIVDLITGLISPANVETKVVESKGYPQRITNGSVQKLLDAKVLRKLGERLYDFRTGSADVMYVEMKSGTGTLEAFYDSKKGEVVLDPNFRLLAKPEKAESPGVFAVGAYAH